MWIYGANAYTGGRDAGGDLLRALLGIAVFISGGIGAGQLAHVTTSGAAANWDSLHDTPAKKDETASFFIRG
jgi:hypothetical protein